MHMNNEKDFLGKEPIGKLLRSLAIPTITAQLINMLYNIVDRIYIGHIPGVRSPGSDRCGCLHAADYDRIGVCGSGGKRRSAAGFHPHGKTGL